MRIHRHRSRKPTFNVQNYRTNDRIKSEQVRVIDDEGNALGVMDTEKAVTLAASKEMDLVEVSPKAEPPVCKILDYGQFKYQKEKEAKKQKAQSKEVELKGVRLTFRMGVGDREVRLNQTKKFLDKGNKVKVEMQLSGREKAHKEVATETMNQFLEQVKTFYPIRVEQEIKFQAGRMTMIVAKA